MDKQEENVPLKELKYVILKYRVSDQTSYASAIGAIYILNY